MVLFSAGGSRCALPLGAVERVVPAVAVTPLPRAPDVILGVVNLAGSVLPVVELRRRLGLPTRAPGLSDRLLVARARRHRLALLVDEVECVSDLPPEAVTRAARLPPRDEPGAAALADGVLLIGDLAGVLTLGEEEQLAEALRDGGRA